MFETVVSADRSLLSLVAELFKAGRCFQQDQVFCQGVTFTQFYILDQIARAGKLPLAELHPILAVDKSTTTRLVKPLVDNGLVERERSVRDSRAVELSLSAEGRRVLARVWDCLAGIMKAVDAAIPDGEREQVYRSVRVFMAALRNACNGGGCCT